jgi:uncharacterized protein (TIGR02118 family)
MIHRLVFVTPKPGMSETDFHRYWRVVHAPLGTKAPQVLGYRICARVPFPELPVNNPYAGAPEIWIEDDAAPLGFVQSDDLAAIRRMFASPENGESASDLARFIDPAHSHAPVVDETRVVGPDFRRASPVSS